MPIVGTGLPLFVDSFDHYDTAHLAGKWDQIYTGSGNFAIVPGGGRNGTQCFRQGADTGLSLVLTTGQGVALMGVAFRPARLPPLGSWTIFTLVSGPATTVVMDLRFNTDGTLELTQNGVALPGGRSVLSLSAGGFYYYIEMRAEISNTRSGVAANTCYVNVNGVQWITLAAGAVTAPFIGSGYQSNFNIMALGRHNIASIQPAVGDFDDFYCGVGGVGTGAPLGDIMVVPLYTTGNGAQNDFTPLAMTNWNEVHEHPPDDDTSYNHSKTAGAIDLFTFDQIVGSPTIFGVQLNNYQRKDDASTYLTAGIFVSGGTTVDSSSIAVYSPGVNYANQFNMRDNDPHTAMAWTAAAVNALQAGTKLISVVG